MSILLNRWPFGALSVIFESHNVTATNITNRTQHFQITDKEVIKYNVSTTGPPPVNTTEEPPLYVAYRHEPWGRLGNQMFQFASALGIARSQGRKLIHPSEFWLFNSFNLSYKFPDMDTSGWTTMYEQHFGFFDTRFMNLPATNIIIEGYLQSYKYFISIQNEIRQQFVFLKHITDRANEIIQEIHATNNASVLVGVHIRRGDFLSHQHQGYIIPEKSFFDNAFEWMNDTLSPKNILFVIISDDLDWCRENFKRQDVTIVPYAEADVHLAVLFKCNHVIMSGGTFGWWGAWMAGGHVVYFNKYMQKGSELGKDFRKKDFYPRGWVGLGN